MVSLRGLLVDLIEPASVGPFLIRGASRQFELARDLVEAKKAEVDAKEMGYVLQEYALILEKEISWVKGLLKEPDRDVPSRRRQTLGAAPTS